MKYLLAAAMLCFSAGIYGQSTMTAEILCNSYDRMLTDSFSYFPNKQILEKNLENNPSYRIPCSYDSLWNDSLFDLVIVRCLIADCLGKCSVTSGWDEKREKYLIEPLSIYGGCRAGGRSRIIWMLIPKLADEKQIVFRHVWLDRIHE